MLAAEVLSVLLDILAHYSGRPKADIRLNTRLRDTPPNGLGFTTSTLSRLTLPINRAFGSPRGPLIAQPQEGRRAETVPDLYMLVSARMAGEEGPASERDTPRRSALKPGRGRAPRSVGPVRKGAAFKWSARKPARGL